MTTKRWRICVSLKSPYSFEVPFPHLTRGSFLRQDCAARDITLCQAAELARNQSNWMSIVHQSDCWRAETMSLSLSSLWHTLLKSSRVHNRTPVFSRDCLLPRVGITDVQWSQIRFNGSEPRHWVTVDRALSQVSQSPWVHGSLLPKRHFGRFIRFCRAHDRDQRAYRQNTRRRDVVRI